MTSGVSPPRATDMPGARLTGPPVRYLAGVDGGGTGTRVRLQRQAGATLGNGTAGPSGLSQGVEQAWRHVQQALAAAFSAAELPLPPCEQVALGLGLAGAGVAAHRQAFLAADPGYALCMLDTDAATQLAGAHGGKPGLVLAAGTGSVAAARGADGSLRQAGGWGFPVGDEGSGAWLGLRAVQHAQAVLDGRSAAGALSALVQQAVGQDARAVLAWCAQAGQHAYAQLAPAVFAAAQAGDPHALLLLDQAGAELLRLVHALQPPGAPLPIAVVGSIGERLAPRWPAAVRECLVPPQGDSADGALHLLRAALARQG